jgi:nucleoside-diphosphate-sugar epimerase
MDMKTLVLGASGATGKLVVSKLMDQNLPIKLLIRSTAAFPTEFAAENHVEVVKGNIDDFTIEQITELIYDCDAIVSCLGHNITFKGIFGKPRRLVFSAIKKLVESIKLSNKKCKLVLMSTTTYTNKKEGEKNTFGETIVFSLLEALLPPHSDNMVAGDFLVHQVSESSHLEWVSVRPDSLIDAPTTSELTVTEKKLRSPIFDPGKTSRINVAQFMVDLLTDDTLWNQWRYKTPVIYNKES